MICANGRGIGHGSQQRCRDKRQRLHAGASSLTSSRCRAGVGVLPPVPGTGNCDKTTALGVCRCRDLSPSGLKDGSREDEENKKPQS